MTQALDRVMTDDGRYYVLFAGTDREERFRSVTAPLGRWDKDGLLPWAGLLAGQSAFEELPRLVAALTIEDCGRTYHPNCDTHGWDVQCPQCRCKRCEPCVIRWLRDRHEAESRRRRDEGTRIHTIADHWASTGVWLVPDEDIRAYIESFKLFVAEYGIRPDDYELLEARVINRTYKYAGTLDAVVNIYRDRSAAAYNLMDRLTPDGQPRVQQARVLVDYKSREKPDRQLYLDQPPQLAGYRFGETLVLKDGTELPMLQVDACAVIQIRPEKTELCLMLAEEPEFATFLALLQADEWALDRGRRAIGARTFSYAPSVTKLRSADARRRKKEQEQAQSIQLPDAPDERNVPLEQAPAAHSGPPVGATPAERGARAAAAARRGPSPVLAEMAEANGVVVKPFVPKGAVLARTTTAHAAILGGPSIDDSEIPF